jgi:cytoskeletal protein RodZ
MKDALKFWGIVLLIVVFFAALWRFDFYAWRTAHPQAPTWTYFFSK